MQTLISKFRFAAGKSVLNRSLVVALVLGPVIGAMLAFGAVAAQDATKKDANEITTEYLPGGLLAPVRATESSTERSSEARFVLPDQGISLDEAELSFVRQAIQRSGGNQTRAAELLGISRDQLRYRLKKLEEVQALTPQADD